MIGPASWTLVFLAALIHSAAQQGASPAQPPDNPGMPRFVVPGHDREMQLLQSMLAKHYDARITCALWDAWLPMSVLWPAVGEQASADAMREFYRRSFTTRLQEPDGYISMVQHRGLAHPAGWPFPTWQQAGGIGWHFTHAGNAYAVQLQTPLATNLDGWSTEAVDTTEITPDRGLALHLDQPHASLTTPPFAVSAGVAPFIVMEWTPDALSQEAKPSIQWTTTEADRFDASRSLPIPQHSARNNGPLSFSAIGMYRHPQWKGTITRLRISWDNRRPALLTLRCLHTAIDTRHPITNSVFVQGCCDYFNWTADLDFLRANISRIRTALTFAIDEFAVRENACVLVPWVGHDGRPGFAHDANGNKTIFPGRGVGNNYWDLLPFGHKDCLATIYLFDALRRAARLERAIGNHPQWNIPHDSPPLDPADLDKLTAQIKNRAGKMFWNNKTGRFVACIDADGVPHDYGYTFLNLEAIHYGFATDQQARTILAWITGRRLVPGDTSQGDDVYHWRFGPRSSTLRNTDWYTWVWHGPEAIPFGGQVQDGGAVLGFSYFDLMARLKILGPDDAWQRLSEIIDWFDEVQKAGGYRPYYAQPGRGTLQGGGTPGGLGMDQEFFESVLVPQVILYGFLGFSPDPDGFALNPRLPQSWPSLTVTRIHLHDCVLDVTASRDRIEITPRRPAASTVLVTLPKGNWTEEPPTEINAQATPSPSPPAHQSQFHFPNHPVILRRQ